MKPSVSYFELFGLPVSFDVDTGQLEQRYLKLQKQFHPDRYSDKPAQDQRLAMQYIADINQAYSALKDPLLRAQHLLSLEGVDASHETSVTRDVDFLMEQMTLREALGEVREASDPFAALSELEQQATESYSELQQAFATSYGRKAHEESLASLARMQFFSKLLAEITELEHELDDF